MAKRRLRPAPPPPELEGGAPPWGSIAVALALVGIVLLAGFGLQWAVKQRDSTGPLSGCRTAPEQAPHLYTAAPPMCINATKTYSAVINTSKGKITLSLFAKDAPKAVNDFVVLAENGYYNGLNFWRVEDWVVQTGDPTGTGTWSPGYTLPDEPGKADWPPGSLGFARPSSGALNGSQFFITRTAWPGGNPTLAYDHFGTVTIGFDIVGQLTSSDRILGIRVTQA